ncbi:MAG: SAM-dependent methyltransferase [Erythrobacter sp.]|jgi:SAM-dependent MidA family methyltransferase|uniref:class I SAM-dependent methyltransferase n=1 Tax=Erythrobacter sp. TaxID=1042 RepID=UPI002B45FD54|nr:SAM-dependent methyltransferase [Erythrobacter sp.]WRH69811.1 MAG: SAM-dependent methyltransferase [Erythrobacter sp.]
MADHTAYPDWIDCRDLRAAEQAAGRGDDSSGVNGVWRSTLRLIDPEDDIVAAKAAAKAAVAAAAEAEAAARAAAREEAKNEARARAEAEARAKAEALARAKAEAEERARLMREERERAKAESLARAAAEREAREKAAAEARARREAEVAERARLAAEEKARKEAEAQARKEAKERALAEERERREAEAREAERLRAEEKARAEAEAREAARLKAEAEEQARREAEEARLKAEAEEKARIAAEEAARLKAEEEARLKAEAAAAAEAEKRAKAEAKAAARAKIDLNKSFRRLIRETGPMSLAHYMAESNARYYASRDPLGDQGDFITAPEVSQMFGELIGLWLADLWVRMGSRKRIHYVELGPGRGTLARDALAAASRYEFAPEVHFVETSPTLRQMQRELFPGCHHHHDLSTLPDDAPLLIVANEFFDALPIHQLVRSADGWFERMVGIEGKKFAYVAGKERMDHIVPSSWLKASQGATIETSPAAVAVMTEIAQRLRDQGGAALIIDYGHMELRAGTTLQALKAHKKVDVFDHPGEADITAHVDFELLSHVAAQNGAEVMGLQFQGEWLRQMGIDTRTEALQRRNPGEKDKLKRQRDRLVDDSQMGTLFKVLGVCGRRWPFGVGFA